MSDGFLGRYVFVAERLDPGRAANVSVVCMVSDFFVLVLVVL